MRIVVAMSGGVDSSVTAGLLHESGHEVIGVTLQLYDHGAATGRKGACCAGQDIHDARRVADRLGIPHYVIDAEARFASAVMADFADSYAAGETPVPCVRCNQTVKFNDLTALARGLGAERLATGHYVRRLNGPDGPELHRAADPARDQSWFLFATTREQLDFRDVHRSGDAGQGGGPCRGRATGAAGGRQAGQPGYLLRPVWQLRGCCGAAAPGCRCAGADRRSDGSDGGPARRGGTLHGGPGEAARHRCPRSRARRRSSWRWMRGPRRVVVGPRTEGTTQVRLREVNWLIEPPGMALRCQVKLRARDEPRPASVCVTAAGAEVELDAPALPAPGQACVFYDGDRVLGGGFIRGPAVDVAGVARLSARPGGSDGGVAQR